VLFRDGGAGVRELYGAGVRRQQSQLLQLAGRQAANILGTTSTRRICHVRVLGMRNMADGRAL